MKKLIIAAMLAAVATPALAAPRLSPATDRHLYTCIYMATANHVVGGVVVLGDAITEMLNVCAPLFRDARREGYSADDVKNAMSKVAFKAIKDATGGAYRN